MPVVTISRHQHPLSERAHKRAVKANRHNGATRLSFSGQTVTSDHFHSAPGSATRDALEYHAHAPDVRFGSKADICSAKRHVRFGVRADIVADVAGLEDFLCDTANCLPQCVFWLCSGREIFNKSLRHRRKRNSPPIVVRSTPKSGHVQRTRPCPLSAKADITPAIRSPRRR